MGKLIRILMACVSGFLWTCSPALSAEDKSPKPPEPEYFIAIVGHPVKMERLDSGRYGVLTPWEIAQFTDFDKKCLAKCHEDGLGCWVRCARPRLDQDDFVQSLSCGFVQTKFESVRLTPAEAAPSRFSVHKGLSVYSRLGEFCNFALVLHDVGNGLLLRKWGKSYYEIQDFAVFEGTPDGYFLLPSHFSRKDRDAIAKMFVPIEKDHQICYSSHDLQPVVLAELKESKFTRRNPGETLDFCETHGLPISKVLSAYKKIGNFEPP